MVLRVLKVKICFLYDVDKDSMDNDIDSLEKLTKNFYSLSAEERKENAEKARKALDDFRPKKIKDWIKYLIVVKYYGKESTSSPTNYKITKEIVSYLYHNNLFVYAYHSIYCYVHQYIEFLLNHRV